MVFCSADLAPNIPVYACVKYPTFTLLEQIIYVFVHLLFVVVVYSLYLRRILINTHGNHGELFWPIHSHGTYMGEIYTCNATEHQYSNY